MFWPGLSTVWGPVLPVRGRRSGRRPDQVFEDQRRLGLHPGEDVLVGLDCERRLGVAEPFAHDFDWHARFEEHVAAVISPPGEVLAGRRLFVGVRHVSDVWSDALWLAISGVTWGFCP